MKKWKLNQYAGTLALVLIQCTVHPCLSETQLSNPYYMWTALTKVCYLPWILLRWRPSCKVVCIRIRLIRHCSYYLFRSSILCNFYSRAAFILLSQSLRWCRREQSSIEWLLYRQEYLLVVANWFASLFWVGFVSSRRVFVSAHATQVFVTPTAATINSRAAFILFSTRGGAATVREWLLIESSIWSSGYSSLTSCYSLFLGAHSYAIANVRSALRL